MRVSNPDSNSADHQQALRRLSTLVESDTPTISSAALAIAAANTCNSSNSISTPDNHNNIVCMHSQGEDKMTGFITPSPSTKSWLQGVPFPRRACTPTSKFAIHVPSSSSIGNLSLPKAIADSRPRSGVDFYGIPNPTNGTPLLLSDLRERLIRQEETIIFAFIERAQFKLNPSIYIPGAFDIPGGSNASFSQFLLYELEKVYATVRRYTSPDEHPFSPIETLPKPMLAQLEYPNTLKQNDVNMNDYIEKCYRNSVLPDLCEDGDDQNYGSSATCDVACLQALSKRIHYGKFIAESKCQENEDKYRQLAKVKDRTGIWNELSNLAVEEIVLKRVENKARSYGSDITVDGARDVCKVNPIKIAQIYKDFIIPLTKEVEVEYILQRYQNE